MELKLQTFDVDYPVAKFDLTVTVVEQLDKSLKVSFEYATDLFYAETIARRAGHFQRITSRNCTSSTAEYWELPLLGKQERELMLVKWNQTQALYREIKQFSNYLRSKLRERQNEMH